MKFLNEILCGDAFQLLQQIPENSVPLCLTDPPYQVSRPNNFKTMGRFGIDFEWDHDFDQDAWIPLVARVIKPAGGVVVCHDWKKLGRMVELFTKLGFVEKDDLMARLVYEKSNPMRRNANRRFLPDKESAVWMVKKPVKGWAFNNVNGTHGMPTITTWPVPPPSGKNRLRHPNEKPLGWFRELVRTLSNPGDFVLDPFAGVGTAALAAEAEGRQWIAFEHNADYHAEAVKRMKRQRGQA